MKPDNDVTKNQSAMLLERSRNKRATGVEWSLGNALKPVGQRFETHGSHVAGDRTQLESDFMGLLTQPTTTDLTEHTFGSAEAAEKNSKKNRTKASSLALNKQRAPNLQGSTTVEFTSSEFGPLQMEVSKHNGLCTVRLIVDRSSGFEGRYRLMASIVEKQLAHRFGEEFKVEFKWQS